MGSAVHVASAGVCALALAGGLLLAACQRESSPAPTAARVGATKPAEIVRLLTRHLRHNDLDAFARDAVPADTYARLEAAWRDGRTRWPLDELPLSQRLPQMLAALAKPGAEAHLRQVFDRQFAHADRELKSTASTLGLFGAQYVQNEGDLSQDEREHYGQIVVALARWAQSAPLADPGRAHAAIPRLTRAARRAGLMSEADFAKSGMRDSLRRLSPLVAVFKQALAGYGLDLDASLGAMEVTLQSQTGDRAKVRMRYTLGGAPIDAVIDVERHDGRWYVSDFLRHAEAAVKPAITGAPGKASTVLRAAPTDAAPTQRAKPAAPSPPSA